MNTLVIQAYQVLPPNRLIPSWIRRCMKSVQDWANNSGFDYQFFSDDFLEVVPLSLRECCGGQIHPVTDIARLLLLRRAHELGYEQAIWLDADVLIFNPERLSINLTDGAAFGYGVMVGEKEDGSVNVGMPAPHNGLVVMSAGHPLLGYYLYAIERILQHVPWGTLARTALGPDLIARITQVAPVECITSVGWLTPALQFELARGVTRLAQAYAGAYKYPLAAADLCHFYRAHLSIEQRDSYDRLVNEAIDRLLTSQGDVINAYLTDRHSE